MVDPAAMPSFRWSSSDMDERRYGSLSSLLLPAISLG